MITLQRDGLIAQVESDIQACAFESNGYKRVVKDKANTQPEPKTPAVSAETTTTRKARRKA